MDYAKLISQAAALHAAGRKLTAVYPPEFLRAAGQAVADRKLTADQILRDVVPHIPELAGVSAEAIKAAIYRAARRIPGYQPRHRRNP